MEANCINILQAIVIVCSSLIKKTVIVCSFTRFFKANNIKNLNSLNFCSVHMSIDCLSKIDIYLMFKIQDCVRLCIHLYVSAGNFLMP